MNNLTIMISGRVFNYEVIKHNVETRLMNGANVHGLKVELAVVRSIMMRSQIMMIDEKSQANLVKSLKILKQW